MTDTAWVEGDRGFYFGARAYLIDNTTEHAWAEKYVVHNPAHSWVIGKYVEADKANSNRQYFSLDGLRVAQPTIAHAPLNINHSGPPVGAFVATDMVHPTEEVGFNPYIEALAVVWKAHYPQAYEKVQAAHQSGSLFFSMEAIPRQVQCIGDGGCGQTFEYAGRQSPTYCSHLNGCTSDKFLIDPHFTAGALIIPPVRPGWKDAEIHSLVAAHAEAAGEQFAEKKRIDPAEWESFMAKLREFARNFSTEQRQKLAKSGAAMSDGSFPISNAEDLKNAIKAVGRAKNPAAAKSHIIKRAKALGLTNLLPEGWS